MWAYVFLTEKPRVSRRTSRGSITLNTRLFLCRYIRSTHCSWLHIRAHFKCVKKRKIFYSGGSRNIEETFHNIWSMQAEIARLLTEYECPNAVGNLMSGCSHMDYSQDLIAHAVRFTTSKITLCPTEAVFLKDSFLLVILNRTSVIPP